MLSRAPEKTVRRPEARILPIFETRATDPDEYGKEPLGHGSPLTHLNRSFNVGNSRTVRLDGRSASNRTMQPGSDGLYDPGCTVTLYESHGLVQFGFRFIEGDLRRLLLDSQFPNRSLQVVGPLARGLR